MFRAMTFSIVGRSADGLAFGVGVASKFLAVGAAVPAAQAGVGAIATQSYANLAYRPDGLALLRAGRSASDTLDELTAADERRETRQAGVVDASGSAATFSGSGCHPWAGGVTGPGYAIQGNILTGPDAARWPTRCATGWLGSVMTAKTWRPRSLVGPASRTTKNGCSPARSTR